MKGCDIMPKALDLTGQRFGRLVALHRVQSRGGKTYWLCQCDCGNQKEIQTNHLTKGSIQSCGCLRDTIPTLMNKISDEEFANIVKKSSKINDIIYQVGFTCISGASKKIIMDRIQRQNLDISHFQTSGMNRKWTDEEIFVKNSPVVQAVLRNHYKTGNYTEYKCSICGLEPFWNGKELSLTLDHINGNNKDDRLENLRWVCPNCDRQLDTFGSKNMKNK